MRDTPTVYAESKRGLTALHAALESKIDRDVIAILGPVRYGAERKVRDALEATANRRPRIAVVLHTGGGIVEVAERMVNVLRHFYADVAFIIPDAAFSAGTVFAMSGDEIYMDFYSSLGPIDPQVERDGKLVPALSYLSQYNRLIAKSASGDLTTAEYAMLSKFDLAELHQFEEARELSTSLLTKWLANYKFKDWKVTESSQRTVTQADREARAKEVARKLSNHEHWHSHARGIPMKVLREEMKLKIQDFGEDPELTRAIRDYFQLATDFMVSNSYPHFVHARNYL